MKERSTKQTAREKKEKQEYLKQPQIIHGHCVGFLAGFEHQLSISTHEEDILERLAFVLSNGNLSPDEKKEVENFRIWMLHTRKQIGRWREKFSQLKEAQYGR